MLKKLVMLAALFTIAGTYVRQYNKKTYCMVGTENNGRR